MVGETKQDGSGDVEQVRDKLLDQLGYVGDELEALVPFIQKINPELLSERPIDGGRSPIESFVSMGISQERFLERRSLVPGPEQFSPDVDIHEILSRFINRRRQLLDVLSNNLSDVWSPELEYELYELVLAESESLQSIAERLYEGNIFSH